MIRTHQLSTIDGQVVGIIVRTINVTTMVITVNYVLSRAAKKEVHRRAHNCANNRYRANQSQLEREVSRECDKERHRQRRALMSDEQKQQVREKARTYQARKREAAATSEPIFKRPPAPRHSKTISIRCYEKWPGGYESDIVSIPAVISAHSNKIPPTAYQCPKCKLMFHYRFVARGHEYGIIGNLANYGGEPKRFWVKLPCGIKDPNNIPNSGSPVYLRSKDWLQRDIQRFEHPRRPDNQIVVRMKKYLEVYKEYEKNPRQYNLKLFSRCNNTNKRNVG